jgi:glutathione synthase/RimK-type ligase-like ATP-grasp enzyme
VIIASPDCKSVEPAISSHFFLERSLIDQPATGTAAPQRRPLNVLSGLPDDRLCEITINQAGGFVIGFPGTADIVQFLPAKYFSLTQVRLGPRRSIALAKLAPGPILNHIADADRCSATLRQAAEIVARSRRACFNHPAAVERTGRDRIAQMLSGIAGLRVPRTIRFRHEGLISSQRLLAASNFDYPYLIRVAGDHGGVSTIKIDGPDSLGEIEKLNSQGKDMYATEFADFASADGKYRKFRIAVIGSEIFLRHMVVGDSWLLHAQRRAGDTGVEEEQMLETFYEKLAPKIAPIVAEVTKRMDLDYFGIDCNIDGDGRMLLFESNACMNIMANSKASPNMWDQPIARIKRAIFTLLSSPRKWRYPPQVKAAA